MSKKLFIVTISLIAIGTLGLASCVPAGPAAGSSAAETPLPTVTIPPTLPSPSATPTIPMPTIVPTSTQTSPNTVVPATAPNVTLADDGQTIHLKVGQAFLLDLGSDYNWTVDIADQSILSREVNVLTIRGSQGLYLAHKPGTTSLTATGDPPCRQSNPPCMMPSRAFSVSIIVAGSASNSQQPVALTAIHMVDQNQGWGFSRESGHIYRTSDGGQQWQDVTPTEAASSPNYSNTTSFLDLTHAWLAANISSNPGATSGPTPATITIYRTSDGGQSWQAGQPITSPSDNGGQLDFIDAQHGWWLGNLGIAAGSNGVILYRSTDGGQTWNQVSQTSFESGQSTQGALPLVCDKNGISFIDADTGWAGASCPGGPLFFYKTTDGGATWTPQTLPTPSGQPANIFSQCMCSVQPPQFTSAQDGVFSLQIFDQGPNEYLYVTHDGGQTWTPEKLPVAQLASQPDFTTSQQGWLTDGQQLYQTQDGGATWTVVGKLPTSNMSGNLDFINSNDGWFSDGQTIYTTQDGGQTWKVVQK